MVSAPLACPQTESWQALFAASVVPDDLERYEDHIETCPACRHHLEQIEPFGQDFLRMARQFGDPTTLPVHPRLNRVMERLQVVKSPLRGSDPTDLYFLRRADRPELLGMLSNYEVTEVIGQGGMGIVLKAHEPALHRDVAIKVLSPALAGNTTARLRFTREAKAAAAVIHENVVAVHTVAEEAGLPYLVMQYVAGESLQARLDREGALAEEEIIHIGLQTARGLAAAHEQGLIHRDIKPANLLLPFSRDAESSERSARAYTSGRRRANAQANALRSEDSASRLNGVVKITDFGLARMVDDASLTRDGVIAGTPEYMAPEQARAEPVDHRADLFSLGSVLYACCTGRPPFHGSSALDVLRQVSEQTPQTVRSLNPTIPAWLENLIDRLMAKKPLERYQSAAEVARLLEEGLAHPPSPETDSAAEVFPLFEIDCVEKAEPAPPRRSLQQWRRRSWLALFLIVTFAGLGSLLAMLADGDNAKQPVKETAEPGDRNHMVFDFRKGIANLPPCTLFGPDLDVVVTTDARGMRINLAEGRQHTSLVGVDVPIWLRGDFDINFGYELLKIDGAVPQYGKSVAMRVMFGDPPHAVTALICRTRKPNGDFFESFKLVKDVEGKDRYQQNRTVRARALNGRLRLTRTGSVMHYFLVDGETPMRELNSLDIGTDDVRMVRLYVTTDFKPAPLDVRFTDLDVRADKIVSAAAADQPSPAQPEAARSNVFLVVALALALLLTLGALGAWLYLSRGRQGKRAAPASILSFACPACQMPLKATPGLAGKKVRCLKCGQVVSVPSINSAPVSPDVARNEQTARTRSFGILLVCFSVCLLSLLVLSGIAYTFFMQDDAPTRPAQADNISGDGSRRLRGHTGPIHDVRFTPDGRLVSTSGWPFGDQSVRIWDPATGRELARMATPGGVHSLDLTPDGRFALVGLNTGEILSFDLQTRQAVKSLKGHRNPVDWVAFAPDGTHVFSASTDGTARMWDLDAQRQRAVFRVAGKWARAGAVFADSQRLLTADNNGLLQIWQVSTRQEIQRINAGPWMVDSLLLRPGEREVLIAGVDGLRLYDLETGQMVRKFQAEQEEVYRAALAPDGRLLTASFDGAVRLWNIETGELLRELGRQQGFAFSVAFSPDGRTAASAGGAEWRDEKFVAGSDLDIRVWDMTAPSLVPAPGAGSQTSRWWIVWTLLAGMLVAPPAIWLAVRRGHGGREPLDVVLQRQGRGSQA